MASKSRFAQSWDGGEPFKGDEKYDFRPFQVAMRLMPLYQYSDTFDELCL